MDQAGVLVHADVDFHAGIPLVAFLGLMHLRISLPFLVLVAPPRSASGLGKRRAESSDQGGIDDCARLHGHAALLEMGFHRLEDLLTKFIFLKQVTEDQDRGRIWDSVADQVDPSETAHGGYIDQRLFHTWIAEAIPLLHQMNSQHRG